MSTHPARHFAAELARSIGSAAVPPDDLRARVDAAFGRNASATLLAPDSADGVAAVLGACSSEAWPVVPLGAGTWYGRGRRHDPSTDRPPILLSTARLNRVTEHEPADLVIGVQAGLPLERLAGQLTAKQQWLPLDPPAAASATIGAIAARADSGPLRAAHGTPRDMVLGIEVATGDGRLLRFGGRVVKNVAGYDGVRLLIGSRGTLGIITALYLRVRGAPRADHTLAVDCGTGQEGARRGADLALAVRDAAACDALELLSPAVASGIGRQAAWTLLMRLLGGEAAVAEGLDRIRTVTANTAIAVNGVAGSGLSDAPTHIWKSLSRLERDATAAVRLSGPTTRLEEGLLSAVHATAGGAATASDDGTGGNTDWMIAAHAADGMIRVWHTGSANVPRPRREMAANDSWTARYEGEAVADAGRFGRPPAPATAVTALAGRLRSVFDPMGILRTGEML